ncbi:type II toxin-antitoxin system YafQ family toxin [Bifidobacterium adolescentis]|nr:type II toxin-antitoxin system YafQ family toxin [Bifidobacterium adolescentis]MDB1507301.1 type II toxin-antitoxin system YafQ family toxin [Bifidobacterium adolescentis]MDB1510875.1 type II toxin-antitoxin system YafQ family toxin [Bifidobacterium adolescentis]MDB1513557.1 type II toxin-antitoxin system YafQ family toxin [Bifidobacterium adolescentis]
MLKSVFRTTQFKKDFKALLKKHYNPDKLRQAIDTLMAQDKQLLSTKYRDHQLTEYLLVSRPLLLPKKADRAF